MEDEVLGGVDQTGVDQPQEMKGPEENGYHGELDPHEVTSGVRKEASRFKRPQAVCRHGD